MPHPQCDPCCEESSLCPSCTGEEPYELEADFAGVITDTPGKWWSGYEDEFNDTDVTLTADVMPPFGCEWGYVYPEEIVSWWTSCLGYPALIRVSWEERTVGGATHYILIAELQLTYEASGECSYHTVFWEHDFGATKPSCDFGTQAMGTPVSEEFAPDPLDVSGLSFAAATLTLTVV